MLMLLIILQYCIIHIHIVYCAAYESLCAFQVAPRLGCLLRY